MKDNRFKNGMFRFVFFGFCLLVSACVCVAQTLSTGKLKTRDNKQVTINGNKAGSGTTILSGIQIQTPEKVGSTIEIKGVGRVDMAPQVDMKIEFSAEQINIELKAGYVVLTTLKGVKGTVKMPDGKTVETDSGKQSAVIARTEGSVGPETSAPVGAVAGGLGAGGTAGVVVAGGAVTASAATAKKGGRGKNLSPTSPRP